MRAAVYESFGGALGVQKVNDPTPDKNSVVVEVKATGVCRSDWHGWMGHDDDIDLPHVPGHELAGVIVATGEGIDNWKVGNRVTVPFVSGCGTCGYCQSGNQQICDHQFQPGFTNWGSFAEYVELKYADQNLVRVPNDMSFETAASLGCRFITSYRGVVHQGNVKGGEYVAIFGCGGVGLAAIMIAASFGATVFAIDIDDDKLELAERAGAKFLINAKSQDPVEFIREMSDGGAHLSIDALGSKETCYNSIASLRKQGRQVQIGLMAGEDFEPRIPMHLVVANELQILGSHGMQAFAYKELFEMISTRKLNPELLIGNLISLEEACEILPNMNKFPGVGIHVINQF